jgi:hypothetical protein
VAIAVEAEVDVTGACGEVDADQRRRDHPGRRTPAVDGRGPAGVVGGAEHRHARALHPHGRGCLSLAEVGARSNHLAHVGPVRRCRDPVLVATVPAVPDVEIVVVRGEV